MKHTWANSLLLGLLALELATGAFGLVAGSPDRALVLQLHAIGALGILVVFIWKQAIVLRSLRRPRSPRPRTVTLFFMGLLLLSMGLGTAWVWTGFYSFAGVTGMSWHIYTGAAAAPFAAWHAWRYTRRFRIGYTADRRTALRLLGVLGAGALAWAATESLLRATGLPGGTRRFTGSHERGSHTGNAFPTTSWLNDRPAPVDVGSWRLTVGGLVERDLSVDLPGLTGGRPGLREQTVVETLDCTGGWYSTQEWTGVPVSDLLEAAGVSQDARSVTFTSVTGYYRRASLEEARRCLLATAVGGTPLSHGHGAPLRLVVPGRRGYEWVKWLSSITVNGTGKWRQPPLPLQ